MSHTVDTKKLTTTEQETASRAQEQEKVQVTPLSTDPAILVDEWRRYQGFVAQVNLKIREHQQAIETAQQAIEQLKIQGLQVVGQANTILRILAGMGVDPNKYGFSGEKESEDFFPPKSVPEPAPELKPVETKEDKGNPKLAALKKRFSR